MLKFISTFAIIVLFSTASFAGMADKIIDDALSKLGGKENLQALDKAICKGKATSSMLPDTSTMTSYFKGEAFRTENTIMGNTSELIWNGTEGWMQGVAFQAPNWKPIDQMMMGQMSQFIFQKQVLFCLISDVDQNDTLKFVGMEEFNGKKVKTVKIKSPVQPGLPPSNKLVKIGAEDNLIYQYVITYDLSNFGRGEQVVTVDVGDYKKVGEVMIPHYIGLKQMGVNADIMFDSVDISSPIDDKIFQNPMSK